MHAERRNVQKAEGVPRLLGRALRTAAAGLLEWEIVVKHDVAIAAVGQRLCHLLCKKQQ